MTDCKCTTVQPRKNGIWACMICRRQFVPLDQIEIADEQKPVSEAELNLRHDYANTNTGDYANTNTGV